jgi:hypothetical protein
MGSSSPWQQMILANYLRSTRLMLGVHIARLLFDQTMDKDRQFSFRPRFSQEGRYAVEVTARKFKRTILARPCTTDMPRLRDIFARRAYDTRKLARHVDICAGYWHDSLIL